MDWSFERSMCLLLPVSRIRLTQSRLVHAIMSTPDTLAEVRAELRRTAARARYRARLSLSAHKKNMTVAIWWEADKLVCMGLWFQSLAYSKMQTRCGLSTVSHSTDSMSGAARHDVVPPHWRKWLCDIVSAMPSNVVASLEHPEGKWSQYREKARRFLLEVALVDYVRSKNEKGLTVSSRAVLARKAFLLQPHVVQFPQMFGNAVSPWSCMVSRWQKRHGLTRGRFRVGCGLTMKQQLDKMQMHS